MSLVLLYGSREAAFTPVDLGTQAVRLGAFSVQMAASMGDVGTSTVAIDDTTGTVGHSGDQIKGYHTIEISEDAVAAGNQLILSSITGKRTYARADSLLTGPAVRITMTLEDTNRITQFQLFRGSSSFTRPAETVGARLTALIANAATPFIDSGLVVYPTTLMDANDYNGQTASGVLDDCAETVGYNWFIYKIDETTSDYCLAFFDPNTSTLYSSTLRLTNVLADIDSTVNGGDGATHTWGVLAGDSLDRDPQNVASGIYMPWAGGVYFGFRGATRDEFGDASITAADNNVKTLTAATARVNRLEWQSSTEEDGLSVSVNLPAANVNDVREGQRIQVKFEQLPGYKSSYTWCRVMYRTVSQQALTDEFYTVDLTLSPQEAGPPVVGIVQQAAGYANAAGITLSLPNPVGIGNSLIVTLNNWKTFGGYSSGPYNGLAYPSLGGTGAWSQRGGNVRTAASGDHSTMQIWTKVATATDQTLYLPEGYTYVMIYEVTGVTYASVVQADLPGSSAVLDAGSQGSPSSSQIAFYVAGQYTPDIGAMGFTPDSGWLTDQSNTNVYFSSPRPSWQGHRVGDGTASSAKLTSTVIYPWCGIAVLFT